MPLLIPSRQLGQAVLEGLPQQTHITLQQGRHMCLQQLGTKLGTYMRLRVALPRGAAACRALLLSLGTATSNNMYAFLFTA